MAVQAQYLSPLNNALCDQFQLQQDQFLFGSYYRNHNTGGQNNFNGTVFSEPESELTCNNKIMISASRKRNRDADHNSDLAATQMFHHQFRFPKLPKTQQGTLLNESQLTSTSGISSSGNSPFCLASNATNDINNHLLNQGLEMDALILLQNERLRSGLKELRKRQCRTLMSVIELQVMKKLEEKESELINARIRNAELEEKVNQLSAENQLWFNVAKNNEAVVSGLKSNLEQLFLQDQGQVKEGYGDSDSVVADEAQSTRNENKASCSSSYMVAGEKTVRENGELKRRKCCKVCGENEVSILVLPCRHLCVCKDCESKFDSCPICNSMKSATLQIFLS